jgi:MscS family membrane protein
MLRDQSLQGGCAMGQNASRRLLSMLALVTLASLAFGAWAAAQNFLSPAASDRSPPASAPPAEREIDLSSPQGAMRTFLEATQHGRFQDAAVCLDLTREQVSRGAQLAQRLKSVIDRLARVELKEIPAERDYAQHYSLAWHAVSRASNIVADADRVRIDVSRDGRWRFTAATVSQTDALWDRWVADAEADAPQSVADADASPGREISAAAAGPRTHSRAQSPRSDRRRSGSGQYDRAGMPDARQRRAKDAAGAAPVAIGAEADSADANSEEGFETGITEGLHMQAALGAVLPDASFSGGLRSVFPEALHTKHFLLPDYQWLCLGLTLILGLIADRVVRIGAQYFSAAWFRFLRSTSAKDAAEQRRMWKPAGMLAQAWVWYWGTTLAGLPHEVQMIFFAGIKFFAIVAAAMASFRAVDIFCKYLEKRASATTTRFDDLLVPLIAKSLKVLVACVGGLMAAESYGASITPLIGGLGLGGAALALASKDAVSNLFGSLTVLADRPFEIGDWVITEGIEGTVEAVGFRSTRIRTFGNSLVSIPNSRLTTAVLDNMGRRRYRRLKVSLQLAYDTTPERLEAYCEGLRELIRRQPYTRKDWYHVYLYQFTDKALEVLCECFLECPDSAMELRERHRLLVATMELASRIGVSFASAPKPAGMGESSSALLHDPKAFGQHEAAKIAGPLPSPDRRPGPVVFGPPAPIDAAA